MNHKRIYVVVACVAAITYLGALWNSFAWDDAQIVLGNPLVHSFAGLGRAFVSPYWPPDLGGSLYRPLTIASFVLDWRSGTAMWFHAVNILWHVIASVLVAGMTRRRAGETAALIAGAVFAVHPVHVEAVANVVGRAELMAATFTLLAVYAALERDSIGWCTLAWMLSLLSKETGVLAPVIVVAGWMLGIARPTPRRMAWYVAAWTVAAVGYVAVREAVLHPYARNQFIAPVFLQQGWVPIRLTAIAALGDVTRLLLFPLKLRTDYSPAERTIVTTPLDVRFAIGAACLVAWGALFALAWRRGRKAEAFGLAWLALAFLPVANLLFPTGILVAERTLYLPSAGLALALGAWGRDLRGWRLGVPLAAVVIAGGIRSALRVPVWRNDRRVILSVLDDSPRSYAGPMGMGAVYLQTGDAEKALAAFRYASSVAPLEGRPYLLAGHAALKLRRFAVADSEFAQVDRMCNPCGGLYRTEAGAALQMGDTAVADSLLAHARRLTSPPARAGNRLNQR